MRRLVIAVLAATLFFVAAIAVLTVLFTVSPLQAQTPPDVSTGKGLARVALRRTDVRGFVLTNEGERLDQDLTAVASYLAAWTAPRPGNSFSLISDELLTWGSVDEASAEMASAVDNSFNGSLHANNENDGSMGIGDEDVAVYSLFNGGDEYTIHFRRGTVTASITTFDPVGTGSWDRVIALANTVDARLQGQIIP